MGGSRGSSFTTIVEVYPPVFSSDEELEPTIGLAQKTRDLVERVRRLQHLADSFLLADVKDSSRIRLPTVMAASVLREKTGVDAIPVITARDSNRQAVVSSLLSAYSLGITGVMLAWGDRYDSAGPKNVYDFKSLSELIGLARRLAARCGVRCRFFAPVDLTGLDTKRGLALAKERLASGADFLLAQPPTADSVSALRRHTTLIRRAGLQGKVLLNIFPFRNSKDIESCRTKFGWKLPGRLDAIGRRGESALLSEAKKVARAVEGRGLPGAYVSTRGRPEVARFILD